MVTQYEDKTNTISIDAYGGGYVEYIPSSKANSSVDDRIGHVTSLAAIARGNYESKNPPKRYKSLLKEAEGKTPSRPLEFLPIQAPVRDIEQILKVDVQMSDVYRYGFRKGQMFYTTMRNLYTKVKDPSDIPFNEEITDFAVFRIKTPMFVWAQIVTHTALSTESQSDRMTSVNDYWLPDDLVERMEAVGDHSLADFDKFKEWMLTKASQREVQDYLRALGYPREIYSRAPYYFKMKEFIITGWVNDDNAWPHFLRERAAYEDEGCKNHTQTETVHYTKAIRKLLEENHGITPEDILRNCDGN